MIRKWVLGDGFASTIKECIRSHQLRWLGHVLRMPSQRLPSKALFALPPTSWRKQRGGQPMTWQKGMKAVTKSLGSAGVRETLPASGWRPYEIWRLTGVSGVPVVSF